MLLMTACFGLIVGVLVYWAEIVVERILVLERRDVVSSMACCACLGEHSLHDAGFGGDGGVFSIATIGRGV